VQIFANSHRTRFGTILLLFFISTANTFGKTDLWDVEWAKSAPLDVEIVSETTETVEGTPLILREIRYTSHEWMGETIRIAGYLAMPENVPTPLPGWLNVTGRMKDAKQAVVEYRVVALSIDKPGSRNSTGPRDTYLNWLDVGETPRNGWMYHFVMAAIRGVTYLSSLPEVNRDAIGVVGTSRGGLCAMLANSVDSRIRLAVPIAATGDMVNTVEYPNNWVASVFLKEGETEKGSAAFKIFGEHFDPINAVDSSHGAVFMILGAQDEFFPLPSTRHVFDHISSDKRLSLIYDCDHGYYLNDEGQYDTYHNGVEIFRRLNGGVEKATEYWLHGEGTMPQTPTVSVTETDKLSFAIQADDSTPIWQIRFIYSTDASYMYQIETVKAAGTPTIQLTLNESEKEKLAYFVEVEYINGYYLTSVPHYAPDFKPKVRPSP
jgi:cephalosporin-C deacetylase-like acetyl esterase